MKSPWVGKKEVNLMQFQSAGGRVGNIVQTHEKHCKKFLRERGTGILLDKETDKLWRWLRSRTQTEARLNSRLESSMI